MALYTELYKLAQEDSALRDRVTVACVVAAEVIRAENGATTNHANRMIWAKQAFSNPAETGQKMLMAVLAQNRTLTVAQLTAANDAALQTAVNAAVDVFATGS